MAAKPIFETRRGLILVRVFRKRARTGRHHSVTVARLYRDGDIWKESSRFGPHDIPLMRRALDDAYTWIFRNESGTR